jgi:hypothetical protein
MMYLTGAVQPIAKLALPIPLAGDNIVAPAHVNPPSEWNRNMDKKDSAQIDRRTVLKAAGAAGLMLATGAYGAQALRHRRRRFARAHVHRRHHGQIPRR